MAGQKPDERLIAALAAGQEVAVAAHQAGVSERTAYRRLADPAFIQHDCRTRLQAVPKTKQLGYYSDAYKLEFVLPKFAMYRRILAQILADDFVKPGIYNERQAVELARLLLRENTRRIFSV